MTNPDEIIISLTANANAGNAPCVKIRSTWMLSEKQLKDVASGKTKTLFVMFYDKDSGQSEGASVDESKAVLEMIKEQKFELYDPNIKNYKDAANLILKIQQKTKKNSNFFKPIQYNQNRSNAGMDDTIKLTKDNFHEEKITPQDTTLSSKDADAETWKTLFGLSVKEFQIYFAYAYKWMGFTDDLNKAWKTSTEEEKIKWCDYFTRSLIAKQNIKDEDIPPIDILKKVFASSTFKVTDKYLIEYYEKRLNKTATQNKKNKQVKLNENLQFSANVLPDNLGSALMIGVNTFRNVKSLSLGTAGLIGSLIKKVKNKKVENDFENSKNYSPETSKEIENRSSSIKNRHDSVTTKNTKYSDKPIEKEIRKSFIETKQSEKKDRPEPTPAVFKQRNERSSSQVNTTKTDQSSDKVLNFIGNTLSKIEQTLKNRLPKTNKEDTTIRAAEVDKVVPINNEPSKKISEEKITEPSDKTSESTTEKPKGMTGILGSLLKDIMKPIKSFGSFIVKMLSRLKNVEKIFSVFEDIGSKIMKFGNVFSKIGAILEPILAALTPLVTPLLAIAGTIGAVAGIGFNLKGVYDDAMTEKKNAGKEANRINESRNLEHTSLYKKYAQQQDEEDKKRDKPTHTINPHTTSNALRKVDTSKMSVAEKKTWNKIIKEQLLREKHNNISSVSHSDSKISEVKNQVQQISAANKKENKTPIIVNPTPPAPVIVQPDKSKSAPLPRTSDSTLRDYNRSRIQFSPA